MPRTTQHPKESSFNFRVDPTLKAAFTAATGAEDKPAAQVLRDFMRSYVSEKEESEYDAWFRRQVQKGMASAGEGKLISAEDIEAEFSVRRAETRRKLANAKS